MGYSRELQEFGLAQRRVQSARLQVCRGQVMVYSHVDHADELVQSSSLEALQNEMRDIA